LDSQGNGAGAITVATYGGDPVSAAPDAAAGDYGDVALGSGSAFVFLTISWCHSSGVGSSLEWYDASSGTWQQFSVQSRKAGCLLADVFSAKSSPTLAQLTGTPIATSSLAAPASPQGYWMVAHDGGMFSFNEPFFGSAGSLQLNAPIVGMAPTWDRQGYWLAGADGGIFNYGDAVYDGSLPQDDLTTSKVVGIVGAPQTDGYYLIGSDGTVWNFNATNDGDLPFLGIHVDDIVGGATTPDGKGLYLVGADGTVYPLLGDAVFAGDARSIHLNAPIVSMTVDPATGGYWLVGRDGGVFSYNAPFFGSTGSIKLNQPVIGMSSTGDGNGYWFTASDGGVFAYGDAQFKGSMGGIPLNQPVLGMSGS
jgi:hypothetical protein